MYISAREHNQELAGLYGRKGDRIIKLMSGRHIKLNSEMLRHLIDSVKELPTTEQEAWELLYKLYHRKAAQNFQQYRDEQALKKKGYVR